MIPSAWPIAGSAICEQPKAQPRTPSKRKLVAVPDDQSAPEPR